MLDKVLQGIEFERPVLIFVAGEQIKGKVYISGLTQRKQLYDLKLTLLRASKQVFHDWRVSKIRFLTDPPVKIDTEVCSTCHLSPAPINTTASAAQDVQSFQFSIDLSKTLCSSVSIYSLHTWYFLQISGRTGSSFAREQTLFLKKDVIVIGLVPGPRDGFKRAVKEVKKVSENGWKSSLTVRMDKAWFLPGESCKFAASVENGTAETLCAIKSSIERRISYRTMLKKDAEEVWGRENLTLWESSGPETSPGGTTSWEEKFSVPFVLPSGLGKEGSPNLLLEFVLIVTVPETQLSLEIILHIGTITDTKCENSLVAYAERILLDLGEKDRKNVDWSTNSLSSNDSGCWASHSESYFYVSSKYFPIRENK